MSLHLRMMWSVIETQVEYNHWIVSNGDTKTYKDIFIWKKHRVHEFYIFHEHNGYPQISNVVAIEERMYSDSLEVAGTADLIAEWKGELAILDWKTSRHKKAPSDCLSYWLQLASYAVMLKERKGLDAKKLVLLFNENDEDCYYYEQSNIQLWIERFKKIREIYRQQTGK